MTLKIFTVLVILLFPLTVFSQPKENYWGTIDEKQIKFTQVDGGLLIKNETGADVSDVEIQTYPSASNPVTRILGMGSYYYKIDTIGNNETVAASWNKFSNTDGQMLKLEEYSFDRVSFDGTIDYADRDPVDFNDHHTITNPHEFRIDRGYPVHVINQCNHPVELAVRAKTLNGEWVTRSWYTFAANEESSLNDREGVLLLTSESTMYFYAKTTDGSDIVWEGDDYYVTIGFRKYGMHVLNDDEGQTDIGLTCN